MKNKIIAILSSFSLFLLGGFTLILSLTKLSNVNWLLFSTLIIFGLFELTNFIINKEKLSYPLGICTIFLAGIFMFITLITQSMAIPFTLLCWLLFFSLTKISKINKFLNTLSPWHLTSFFIIVFIGLLSVIGIYYYPSLQIYLVGLFFYIIGTIELLLNA